ncbi:MAG TPA: hypothetical protein VLI04_23300 [Nocardioidaceae bacterium]|nr:hypothetical protein [Nocardioidaceae bacterium]
MSDLDAVREERWTPPPGTLGLVLELRTHLEAAAVKYCHFKSNDMLARSATGENDLDLLVDRRDAQRLHLVMSRLGFRRAIAPGGREHPGVSHHYALDTDSGRFVHVHLHFTLTIGDDASKNFRLPIEAAYLDSTRTDEILPVPSEEFELAVFVVRMMLKHASIDALLTGKAQLGANELRELRWLRERADAVGTNAVVAEHLGGIGVDLWSTCLASLESNPGVIARLLLGRRMIRALRPHARRRASVDLVVRFMRKASWAGQRYVLRRPTRKRLERAGALIAIVGGDGAGKSTAVEGAAEWLGSVFVVHQTHLGKPPHSLLTLAVKGPMYVGRRFGLLSSTAAVVDPRTAVPSDFPGTAWALWHALTARDRLKAYRKARRVADRGGLVVSDRWPLPNLHLMDGVRTDWILDRGDAPSRVAARLARWERSMYAHIAPPDVLLVLRLDPEVAVRRRDDEPPDYVRARNTEVFEADWSTTHALVIDAEQPAEEVLAHVRHAIWERL